MGDWRYSSIILDLGTRVSGQLHAPVGLPLAKELRIPIGKEAEWVPDQL
jgi:hypothetical protein